jgi:hypothetical protein
MSILLGIVIRSLNQACVHDELPMIVSRKVQWIDMPRLVAAGRKRMGQQGVVCLVVLAGSVIWVAYSADSTSTTRMLAIVAFHIHQFGYSWHIPEASDKVRAESEGAIKAQVEHWDTSRKVLELINKWVQE